MLAALIPQLIPILGTAIDKVVPDNVSKDALRQEMEKALVYKANSINLRNLAPTNGDWFLWSTPMFQGCSPTSLILYGCFSQRSRFWGYTL